MLSTRGQAHAASGLFSSYERAKKAPYNKVTCPDGEVSFANAENFLTVDILLNFFNNHAVFKESHLSYNEGPVGTKRLREAMASHLNTYFDPHFPVTEEQVTFTAGVTGLNEMVAFNLTNEGEAILLGRPNYGSFKGDLVTKSKCQLVYASFGDIDQFSVECVATYENAFVEAQKAGVKVRALLICNPHNPLGKCYPKETLEALCRFCEKNNLHLISDEVYALSVFEVEGSKRTPFTSVLALDSRDLIRTDQIHVLYGMSKAYKSHGRFNWPSELSCAIAETILEDRAFIESYTARSRELLSQQYTFATNLLEQAGIEYFKGGNAGFFIWVDLSPYLPTKHPNTDGWTAEAELKKRLSDAGVILATGLAYKAEMPGWFRVIFSVERDMLEEGLRRIITVCKE